MNVIDFNAFRTAKAGPLKGIKSPVALSKGAPGREWISFEGDQDTVVDVVLDWLAETDPFEPVQFTAGSETVMLVRKGSVDFIETCRRAGTNEWFKQLPRREVRWWSLDEDAGICRANVLISIITQHRNALARLLRDGLDRDSWRSNGFIVAMDDEKNGYY